MSNPAAAAAARPAGNFNGNTRLKFLKLPPVTRPVGGGTYQLVLPKVGFLARIHLRLQVAVAGTLSAPNALGVSSIISRIRLSLNTNIDIQNLSGAGYCYLLDEVCELEEHRMTSQNQGRTAVTATNFNYDIVLPVMLNLRDPVGLIMLQSEQLQAILSIDWLADANVATGATVTVTTGDAWMEVFTVPQSPADYPDISVLHQLREESQAIAATGDITYNYLRAHIYLQMLHALGIGASGADGFSNVKLRVNQADYLLDWTPGMFDMQHRLLRGRARPAGGMYLDFLGSSGLGNYGLTRDIFNTLYITDWAAIITASATGTLFSLLRQLVRIT